MNINISYNDETKEFKATTASGEELEGIVSVKVNKIVPDKLVTVTMTFHPNELNLENIEVGEIVYEDFD